MNETDQQSAACLGKRAMTRQEASICKTQRGFTCYQCEHCGMWHASGSRTVHEKSRRGRRGRK